MIESERHRLILAAVQEKPVVTVQQLVDLTSSSEATIRRDISELDERKKLRRVRGGAESLYSPQEVLEGRAFSISETLHVERKRAIAREAVALCADGDPVIINGGTTTFQMVHFMTMMRLTVLSNSFPIIEHLMKNSRNSVMIPGGTIYREQAVVVSPFDDNVVNNFYARRMFMGAHGVGRQGIMESDPLLIQAERKLIEQSEELVILVDSSKFNQRSGLILTGLSRVGMVITDDGVEPRQVEMLEEAGVVVKIAEILGSTRSAGRA
jgi:DeoR family transcriptional regulator, ulaG and ulaABCDEF operon transcriptional repressor